MIPPIVSPFSNVYLWTGYTIQRNSFLTAFCLFIILPCELGFDIPHLQFSCGGGGSDGSKDSHDDLDTF